MWGGRAVLEVPLKDSTAYVNLQHVGGNRFVLETRTDYDEMGANLENFRNQGHYSNDEQYKAFVERSMVAGGQWHHNDAREGNKMHASWGNMQGMSMSPYMSGGYGQAGRMNPMGMSGGLGMSQSFGGNRWGNTLPRDASQTDESVVFATKGTKDGLTKSQMQLETETAERQRLMDSEQFERKTRYEGLAHSKPWMELEPKFFEEPRFLFSADSNGNVKQWSLRDSTVVKDMAKTYHKTTVYVIASTRNSKYLFTSDQLGNVKQISVADSSIVKDYGKVFKAPITALECSPDSRFLLVGDENGNLKQFDVETQKLMKSYGKVLPGAMLTCAVTPDSATFFVAGSQGHCKQFCLNDYATVRDYGKIHKGSIFSICVTADSNYLFTSDKYGYMKQWGVKDGNLIKDYSKVHERFIYAMATTPDSRYLFVTGNRGCLVQWDIRSQTLRKDYGRAHGGDTDICEIVVSPNSKHFWTSDDGGSIKEWSVEFEGLQRDYGRCHTGRIHAMTIVH
jgi:hypothetical protein